MTKRIPSYSEFWRFYVGEHQAKANRKLHFLGISAALLCLWGSVDAGSFMLGFLALVFVYGPAWIGHFFFERNHPATFRYPLWSLMADLQMYALMCAGRMDREVGRNSLVTMEEY